MTRWVIYDHQHRPVGMVTETPTGPRLDTQDETLRKDLVERLSRPALMPVGGEIQGVTWDGLKTVEPGEPDHPQAVFDGLMSQTDYSAKIIESN